LPGFLRVLFGVLVLGLLISAPAHAAEERANPTASEDGQAAILAAVQALQEKVKDDLRQAALALEELRKKVDASASADAQLAQLKLEADALAQTISSAIGTLENRYNLVAKRLEDIGAAPAEGAVEDAALSGDRKRLQGEKAQMNAILTDADVLDKEAVDLTGHITDLRRKLFNETLFRYTEINGQLFADTLQAAANETDKLWTRSSNALEFMWKFKRQGLFITLGITLLVAIAMTVLVRWTFQPLIHRDPRAVDPPYMDRLSVAFWSAVIPSIAVALVVLIGLMLLLGFNVLREDISQILRAVLWVVVGVFFLWKLARAIVSPDKPQWKLVPVSQRGAQVLVGFSVLLGLLNGVSYILGQTNVALDSPVVLTVAEGFFSTVLIGLTLILLSFVRPMELDNGRNGAWPKVMRALLIVVGVGLILTTLFGYIGLAQFAATQIVVTSAMAVTMYIGFLSGHAISRHNAFAQTLLGKRLARRFNFDAIRLDQIGLLAGLGVYLLVCLFGLPLIMLKWGFNAADIWAIFIRLFTEIQIGNISISLVGILAGILLFVAGYFATKWFQRWLDSNVLARSQVDVGVRNSVNTALGYAGIALAGVIGISAAGINLSSLALVAGALSLGIGFGLQTIVQNFVSGLILLAERPFKVGDWIVAGTTEGFVRRISVRATEVETFQNQSIIVPNSQLINASVGNWTLRNTLARSEVAVSVAYDSDPRRVMELLLEIARSHPLVLTMPEPNVGFQAFGQYTMDFELRFYLADLFQGGPVKNEIRVQILERFREEGIVIPVAQPNVMLRSTADEQALERALEEEGLSPAAARRVRRKAEGIEQPSRARSRDMDLVDDERGPHDGLHHALDPREDDADGEPDNQPGR
jgi:small-conductance mechanosensitive channel